MVLRHAYSLLSAARLNINLPPFGQILWILLILFYLFSLMFLAPQWFISFIGTRKFNQNIWPSFIYFIFCCARPFNKRLSSSLLICFFYMHIKVRPKTYDPLSIISSVHLIFQGSSLINFFYFRTTVRPKSMVFFQFIFPFCTTIRPSFMVLFHLLLLFCTTTQPKICVLIDLISLFVHDHSTKIYRPLSFILSLRATIWRTN